VVLLFLLLALVLFFYISFGVFSPSGDTERTAFTGGGDKVGLVDVFGPIYQSQPVLDQLEKVENNPSIKAILLRLETPGGGVAASQEVYQRLAYLRDTKRIPIVASMSGVAASGGYYIALGADTIVANPGTITGSIGVIGQFPVWDKLADKIGVKLETVKSGKFKDVPSPARPLSPDERDYMQSLINDMYQQFVAVVAHERHMEGAQVELLADGRVYTGRQALEAGLIDLLGTPDDALKLAAEMAGISGKPHVLELKEKKLTMRDLIFGDLKELLITHLGLMVPLRYELSWKMP
jgi:protease-4